MMLPGDERGWAVGLKPKTTIQLYSRTNPKAAPIASATLHDVSLARGEYVRIQLMGEHGPYLVVGDVDSVTSYIDATDAASPVQSRIVRITGHIEPIITTVAA
jgi:hypothetical protein